jgi:hypothetical protein
MSDAEQAEVDIDLAEHAPEKYHHPCAYCHKLPVSLNKPIMW